MEETWVITLQNITILDAYMFIPTVTSQLNKAPMQTFSKMLDILFSNILCVSIISLLFYYFLAILDSYLS